MYQAHTRASACGPHLSWVRQPRVYSHVTVSVWNMYSWPDLPRGAKLGSHHPLLLRLACYKDDWGRVSPHRICGKASLKKSSTPLGLALCTNMPSYSHQN